ncbi:MAG TPA: carboxypeptidase-like regulatory domain-containing protein [Bryobacteraceae bacterium]|nr:carboxypeptidase-like regulatory domain-containing protein [Bryobacteraceae bacterium]
MTHKSGFKTWLLLAVAVLTLVTPLAAQDISGTIEGSVLDPSGAFVSGAKVTVTNQDRNQVVRTVTTDASGAYAAPFTPVGTYSVKVEAPGFKTATRSDIVLNVKDDLKINISLEVGAVSETVDVTAQSNGVELATAANASTIQGTQVRELMLSTRNYEQLVSLSPGVTANATDELYIGVSAPAGTAATIPYSINGQRNSANNWTVDGADNVDRGSNLTLMVFPSVDSIDEFKISRSLYTADTGRAGGAQISVVTRAGTSQFHGSLYEFIRNDDFNANNFINNANKVNVIDGKARVPPLRWNDFGGTIGGPVYIPGHYNTAKNKTFFFFSEEARRIITYTTFQPIIPTSGMIAGTFPTPVCVVYTTTCAQTATQIAPSQINPIASQYIKDIYGKVGLDPVSTSAGFFAQRNLFDSRQEIVRLDHSFGERFSLWGKFENDSIPTTEPGGLFTGSNIPNGAITSTNSPGQAYVIHALAAIRPTLINDIGFTYSHSAIDSTPLGLTAKANSPDINVPEPFANPEGVLPTIVFSSATTGSSIIGFGPYHEANRNYTGFDNATWIHGAHTFRAGFSINRYEKTENAASGQGSFTFSTNGAPAGTSAFNQAFANFLLGNVASFTQPSTDITPDLHAWQTEAYLQDDYRFNPRLTIYAGVRWSYFGQPNDSNGLLTNFDPAKYSAASAAKIDPATGNIVAGSAALPYTDGIIIGGKTSPFGSKVAPDRYANFAPRIGFAWDPYGTGKTSIRGGYGIYYDASLFGTYEQSIFQNPPFVQNVTLSNAPFDNISAGTPPGTVSTVYARATQLPNLIPYVQQWSFGVQRDLYKGLILDVSYAGSKGTHLIGIVDINQAYPGVALAAGLHAANGNTVFTTADDPRINAVRPYLGYNAINAIESAFDSNYNSLQLSARKSFTNAGLVQLSYTWSKNLTDNASDRSNAPQNSYDWHEAEYGPATLDRKHVVAINYVYTLPFLAKSNNLAGHVLGGWELSGILSFYTGSPFTVTTSNVDPAGLGLLGNSAASARPDEVCDPTSGFTRSYAEWFNTACFQPVPQGQVRPGNAPRGAVRGPGYGNLDGALMKNFAIHERLRLQLRGEAFNLTNHTDPNGFGSTNNTSTLFGQITSFRAPRRIQIGAKLTF